MQGPWLVVATITPGALPVPGTDHNLTGVKEPMSNHADHAAASEYGEPPLTVRAVPSVKAAAVVQATVDRMSPFVAAREAREYAVLASNAAEVTSHVALQVAGLTLAVAEAARAEAQAADALRQCMVALSHYRAAVRTTADIAGTVAQGDHYRALQAAGDRATSAARKAADAAGRAATTAREAERNPYGV